MSLTIVPDRSAPRKYTLPDVIETERHGQVLKHQFALPADRCVYGICELLHYSERPDFDPDALYLRPGNDLAGSLLKRTLGGAASWEREAMAYRLDLCADNWDTLMDLLATLSAWWHPRVSVWLRRTGRDLSEWQVAA